MAGWRREMLWEDTELPWVAPSPNMPTPDTARVYPGGCLLEGTNLSEGRGTTRPFEWVGAPYLDGPKLAAALERRGLPGVRFRPITFEPTFQKWARRACEGVQVHVTDWDRFRSYATYVALIAEARRQAPRGFRWKRPPYEYQWKKQPIDLIVRHRPDPPRHRGRHVAGADGGVVADGSGRLRAGAPAPSSVCLASRRRPFMDSRRPAKRAPAPPGAEPARCRVGTRGDDEPRGNGRADGVSCSGCLGPTSPTRTCGSSGTRTPAG